MYYSYNSIVVVKTIFINLFTQQQYCWWWMTLESVNRYRSCEWLLVSHSHVKEIMSGLSSLKIQVGWVIILFIYASFFQVEFMLTMLNQLVMLVSSYNKWIAWISYYSNKEYSDGQLIPYPGRLYVHTVLIINGVCLRTICHRSRITIQESQSSVRFISNLEHIHHFTAGWFNSFTRKIYTTHNIVTFISTSCNSNILNRRLDQ